MQKNLLIRVRISECSQEGVRTLPDKVGGVDEISQYVLNKICGVVAGDEDALEA
jgi:hypothetical protein